LRLIGMCVLPADLSPRAVTSSADSDEDAWDEDPPAVGAQQGLEAPQLPCLLLVTQNVRPLPCMQRCA
jgi:hypothetical protein